MKPQQNGAAAANESDNTTVHATWMIVISIVSSLVVYGVSIYLARLLGPAGFQEYAIAIAELSLLATFCEFGTGKFALRIVPHYVSHQQWNLAAGYWRFSLAVVVLISVLAALFIIGAEAFAAQEARDYELRIAMLFLPVIALLAVAAEFVMANRFAVAGLLVVRLVCPAATIALIGLLVLWLGELSLTAAIVCFGLGGSVGLLLAIGLFYLTSPRRMLTGMPEYRFTDWVRSCIVYALLAFVMSWIFRISLIVLEIARIDELEVARFAAALETACFALLIAKSTNKLYAPELALIMSRQDWSRGLRMRRSRLLLVGTASVGFFITMLLFGNHILALFGPEFVDGHAALCFISFGTCVTTTFAMAPEYLKFAERTKTILLVAGLAGIGLSVLTWILASQYGATGAGIAFAMVVSSMATAFFLIAERLIRASARATSA